MEYHPISAKDQSTLHQFGAKVWPSIFLGYVLYAGGIWKGDILIADIEELEQMDASELHARRLNAKEVLTPMRGDIFIFPVADNLRVRSASENIHLNPRSDDFWSMTGDFIWCHRVEPRVKLYKILTITGTWMEIVNCQINGPDSQDLIC